MAGIHVSEELIAIFNDLKIEKKYRFLSFGLNEERNAIVLYDKGERSDDLTKLPEVLPQNGCRYVIYDFEYKTKETMPRDTCKLILIVWVPDIAPIKVKVPFSATKSEIKGSFTGIVKDIQASDFSSLNYDELRDECC